MGDLMIKIAGVVILYYPDNNIKDNILSYLDDIGKLYVVDNTPHKNNKKLLPNSKKIEYISNNENLGIATALNIGAKKATEDKFDFLLTMDSDSKFSKNNLSKMIQWLKDNKTDDIGLISPFHELGINQVKPKNKVDYQTIEMTSGNIINLDIYQKIGGFKDWLFIDSVDFDYCFTIIGNGYKTVRLNNSILDHSLGNIKVDKFLGKDITHSNHSFIRRYYITRNSFYMNMMYRKKFPKECSKIMMEVRRDIIKIILLEKDKYRKLRNMIRGYIDYKKGITGPYKYKN
jgi:rhamnosyltransferase